MKQIKEVVYYWYDHLLIRQSRPLLQLVENSINNHDWNTFLILQDILNNTKDIDGNTYVFLPDDVIVYYEDGGSASRELTEDLFNKIDSSSYECG